jgi:hypothetical protein
MATEPKTNLTIRPNYKNGDNIFALIAPVYNALKKAGYEGFADDMQKRIDKEAESPADVNKIVREYVRVI